METPNETESVEEVSVTHYDFTSSKSFCIFAPLRFIMHTFFWNLQCILLWILWQLWPTPTVYLIARYFEYRDSHDLSGWYAFAIDGSGCGFFLSLPWSLGSHTWYMYQSVSQVSLSNTLLTFSCLFTVCFSNCSLQSSGSNFQTTWSLPKLILRSAPALYHYLRYF